MDLPEVAVRGAQQKLNAASRDENVALLRKQKHTELPKAKLRRRTSHEPNRMQMSENKGFCSFAFDSARVKYGV